MTTYYLDLESGSDGLLVVDVSSYARTVYSGTAFTGDPGTYKFGQASAKFSGTVATASNNGFNVASDGSFNFGTGDWTIEFFINPINFTNPYASVMGSNAGSWSAGACSAMLYGTGAGSGIAPSATTNRGAKIGLTQNNGTAADYNSISTLTAGTWYHVAFSKVSNSIYVFINGTLEATYADTRTWDFGYNGFTCFGYDGWDGTNSRLAAYVDEIRVTKGLGRYTASFTVPTAPYDNTDPNWSKVVFLSHLDNYFVNALDESASNKSTIPLGGAVTTTAQFKFGSMSLLNTSGGGVSVPADASLRFGAGQFTLEAFIRPSASADFTILSLWSASTGLSYYFGYVGGTFVLWYSTNGVNGVFPTYPARALTLNSWIHVAVDRDASNTVRIYVDGVVVSTSTISASFDASAGSFVIGNQASMNSGLQGYIDAVRVTKGVARYAGAFTPPAATYPTGASDPNWANVSLLSNFEVPTAGPGLSYASRLKTFAGAASLMANGDTLRVKASPPATLVGNATWTYNSNTVTLASPVTANINLCEGPWTPSTNCTSTTSGGQKQGSTCSQITVNAAFTTGLAAYTSTGAAASNSLTNRAANLLGSAGLTPVVSTHVDEGTVAITLPFPVLFNGVPYTTVYVCANSYMTFGSGVSAYQNLSGSNPAIPGFHINAGDHSYNAVYAGSTDGNATYRIRFEGSNAYNSSVSDIFWEVTFTAATPGVMQLDIGSNAASGTGTSGFTNGSAYFQTFTNGTVNTGYTYTTTSAALDLSGYQQVSFWLFMNNTCPSGYFSLRLCSDTAGATPVATIPLPAYNNSSAWQAVTVNLGTNLPASVQSVALYADADYSTGSSIAVYFDNIIACKAASSPDSLTLGSLIGKACNLSWSPSTTYNVGDLRRPTGANRTGFTYRATGTPHRYWRINISANNGNLGLSEIAEFEMRTVRGGSNVASGGTALASSDFGSTYAASKAFDGSTSTFWASNNPVATLQYDYGAGNAKDIIEVALRCVPPGETAAAAPKDFTIQYSDDGAAWTTALTVTNQTGWGSGEIRTFTFPATTVTSGTTEPAWPQDTGLTVADGSMVWTCFDLEETWLPIKSIVGTTITLDTLTSANATALAKYFGATETCATYKRQPVVMPSSSNGATLYSPKQGVSLTAPTLTSGGWNRTDMSTQADETWIDMVNSSGHFVYTSATYTAYESLGIARPLSGFWNGNNAKIVASFKNYHVVGANTGLNITNAIKAYLNNVVVANPWDIGVNTQFATEVEGKCVSVFGCVGGSSVGIRYGVNRTRVNYMSVKGNSQGFYGYAVNSVAGGDAIFSNVVTANNTSWAVNVSDIVYGTGFVNSSFGEATPFQWNLSSPGIVWSHNHNGVKGKTYKYYAGRSVVQSVQDVVHTAGGWAWKFTPDGVVDSLPGYQQALPLRLSVAKLYCQAGITKNVAIWTRRDGTNVKGQLVIGGGQVAGVPNTLTVDCQPATNTWVKSSALSFTPSENGVVEIEFLVWNGVNSTESFWIDDLTVANAEAAPASLPPPAP